MLHIEIYIYIYIYISKSTLNFQGSHSNQMINSHIFSHQICLGSHTNPSPHIFMMWTYISCNLGLILCFSFILLTLQSYMMPINTWAKPHYMTHTNTSQKQSTRSKKLLIILFSNYIKNNVSSSLSSCFFGPKWRLQSPLGKFSS